MHRRRLAALAVLTAAALSAAACSNSTGAGTVTVTRSTYQPNAPSGSGSAAASGSAALGSSSGSSAPGNAQSSTLSAGSPAPTSSTGSSAPSSPAGDSGTARTTGSSPDGTSDHPDGFVPTKLKPGEKPPQFIAVSFDGAGWHEKWQYWFGIAKKVPFHFTANLTGLYLVDEAHKDFYQGSGHPRGATALGANFWYTPAEVKQQILDLNTAYAAGDEIATHFMGHFCGDGGAKTWSTAAWNSDLDQFFDAFSNYKTINKLPDLPTLKVLASEVIGERTPCLEGTQEALYPALVKHHMQYDQSFTRHGIAWPNQSPKYKIWNMGMAEFPLHGNAPGHGPNHFQITMDYNFWYSQEYNASTGKMNDVSKTQSTADSEQVQATYQDMLDGALAGSHAPLLLGNHFNDWNNNAYTEALGHFLLANCGKPGVYCVPFRDVFDWMKMQDPKVLAQLQAEPPIVGPPGSNNH